MKQTEQNLIDFGYGYPELRKGVDTNNIPTIPFYSVNTKIPIHKEVFMLPPAIAPDEVFVYLSEAVVSNTMKRYLISNYGRIWDTSLNKFVPSRFNKPFNPDGSNTGYYVCHISRFKDPYNLESVDIYVHRAVIMSFYEPPNWNTGFEVDHINMIKTDNRLSNLRYITPADNKRLCRANLGSVNYGYKRNVITTEDAHNICRAYSSGRTTHEIANMLEIEFYTVLSVLGGYTFKHVYVQYDLPPISSVYSIPEEAIRNVCELIQSGTSISSISSMTGLDKYFIANIRDRKLYFEISADYNFINSDDNNNFSRQLPDRIVHEVCRRLSKDISASQVAKDMNINLSTVTNIKAKKIYTHISKQYNFNRLVSEKISDDTVHQICKFLQDGLRDIEIGQKLNIHPYLVGRIRRKDGYSHISDLYTYPSSNELGPMRELNDITVHEVCRQLAMGKSTKQVSDEMKIKYSLVHSIKTKTSYNDISSLYVFPNLSSIVTEEQVRIACEGLQNGDRTSDILKKSGICKRTLYRIRDRETYKDISKDYKF